MIQNSRDVSPSSHTSSIFFSSGSTNHGFYIYNSFGDGGVPVQLQIEIRADGFWVDTTPNPKRLTKHEMQIQWATTRPRVDGCCNSGRDAKPMAGRPNHRLHCPLAEQYSDLIAEA